MVHVPELLPNKELHKPWHITATAISSHQSSEMAFDTPTDGIFGFLVPLLCSAYEKDNSTHFKEMRFSVLIAKCFSLQRIKAGWCFLHVLQ